MGENKKAPILTGGTFFILIFEATIRDPNVQRKWGQGTGTPEENVFDSLVKVAVPTCNQKTYTAQYSAKVSGYKCCSSKYKNSSFSFGEQPHITTFNSQITNSYQDPLGRMVDFVEKYIDVGGKGEWLVRALLELICDSGCVSEEVSLYVCEDGNPVKLSALRTMENICLPAFLLGIWHFIAYGEIDNIEGKDTADLWCEPYGGNKRKLFKSNIGQSVTRKLNISMPIISEVEVIEEDCSNAEQGEPCFDQAEPNPADNPTIQFIYAPTIFSTSGENTKQIYNTGTINMI